MATSAPSFVAMVTKPNPRGFPLVRSCTMFGEWLEAGPTLEVHSIRLTALSALSFDQSFISKQ